MIQQDYMFLIDVEDTRQVWIAFCKKEGYTQEQARMEIDCVLKEKKGISSYRTNYLGVVDYHNMDVGIVEQLHYFEKFDPVWLLSQGIIT
jgi:hypothetical protein